MAYANFNAALIVGAGSGLSASLARALAPYLAAQLVVLALVVLLPGLAHLAQPKASNAPPVEKVDDETARKRFNDMLKLPPPPEE